MPFSENTVSEIEQDGFVTVYPSFDTPFMRIAQACAYAAFMTVGQREKEHMEMLGRGIRYVFSASYDDYVPMIDEED